ncbi:MAG: hypothetical protein EOP11_20905 [Proteobacteria bacterium]|nr:MAG: hypothetical protein EOP11_20905 [Pseudomonadota bacterium]
MKRLFTLISLCLVLPACGMLGRNVSLPTSEQAASDYRVMLEPARRTYLSCVADYAHRLASAQLLAEKIADASLTGCVSERRAYEAAAVEVGLRYDEARATAIASSKVQGQELAKAARAMAFRMVEEDRAELKSDRKAKQ